MEEAISEKEGPRPDQIKKHSVVSLWLAWSESYCLLISCHWSLQKQNMNIQRENNWNISQDLLLNIVVSQVSFLNTWFLKSHRFKLQYFSQYVYLYMSWFWLFFCVSLDEIGPPGIRVDISDVLLHVQISPPGGENKVMTDHYYLSYQIVYWKNSSDNEVWIH